MQRRLIYLGGNGHSAARLRPAREALARLTAGGAVEPFDLFEVPYPGFEDRPRASDYDEFLASLSLSIGEGVRQGGTAVLYATGIGGLLALDLRARGIWLDVPLLMQAPVLWGLERRLMPRLMRLGLSRLLKLMFARSWFQHWFASRHFVRPVTSALQADFFAGYARCPAQGDLFRWLTPGLLRWLERQFAARPEGLRGIGVWWGGRDRVVNLRELHWAEQALHANWPVHVVPEWGHYPMIDEPEGWVRALSDVLANPEFLPGPVRPEARYYPGMIVAQ